MQIGSILEFLLLWYALMDRIDLLRMARDKASAQANAYLHQLNEELEVLVAERTQALEEQNKTLNELAVQDSMTGLLNHKASIDCLAMLQSSAKRYVYNLAVIMMDIDKFKSINDGYGHQADDKLIVTVANVLKDTLRKSDGCGRYGGDEFIMILPESNARSAELLAERIRKDIHEVKIPEIDNTSIGTSFGVAEFDPSHPDNNLINMADSALYKAKKAGRNQVICSGE